MVDAARGRRSRVGPQQGRRGIGRERCYQIGCRQLDSLVRTVDVFGKDRGLVRQPGAERQAPYPDSLGVFDEVLHVLAVGVAGNERRGAGGPRRLDYADREPAAVIVRIVEAEQANVFRQIRDTCSVLSAIGRIDVRRTLDEKRAG